MKSRRALYVLLLLLAGGVAACERAERLGDLTAPVAPQFSHDGNGNANRENWRYLKRKSGTRVESGMYCTRNPINNKGGEVVFPGGSLDVSRGAVKNATIFCATVNDDDDASIKVELRAFENGSWNPVTNFNGQVKLTLDMSEADVSDWTSLGVVYRVGKTPVEKMPTSYDKRNETVTATLTHFSDYSVLQKDPTPILD